MKKQYKTPYDQLQKQIINSIQAYNNTELLIALLNYLCVEKNKKFSIPNISLSKECSFNRYFIPFLSCFLMRWIIQYGKPIPQIGKISDHDIIRMYEKIHQMWCQPNSLESIELPFFRSLTNRLFFQQLSYQINNREFRHALVRETYIFCNLGSKYDVDKKFEARFGMSIREFQLCNFLINIIVLVYPDRRLLPVELLMRKFPEYKIDQFLKIVSKNMGSYKAYLNEKITTSNESYEYQLAEFSPLYKHPFIQDNNNYWLLSPELLKKFSTSAIYDKIKEAPQNEYQNYLGIVFEEYVATTLKSAKHEPLRESVIKKLIGEKNKTADFLIQNADYNYTIILDAKCVQLSIESQIKQTSSLLQKHTDLVAKGIAQILITYNELIESKHLDTNAKFYGIVITYKDHLMLNVKEYWDIFEKTVSIHIYKDERPIEEKYTKLIDRLLVIPIDCFDYLIAGTHQRNECLSETLEDILEKSSAQQNEIAIISNYLEKKWKISYTPDFLKDEYNEISDSIVCALQKAKTI